MNKNLKELGENFEDFCKKNSLTKEEATRILEKEVEKIIEKW